MQRSALRVRRVGVRSGADHEFALVRLADVGMDGVRHHDARKNRFDRFRHQSLQGIAFQGQADSGQPEHHARVAGRRDAHFAGADEAARGFQRSHRAAVVSLDAGHLAVLDDVDAQCVGGSRIAPRHRIMARRTAAPLQSRTEHGIADIVLDVQWRTECLGLFRLQPLVVHAVAAIRVHVPLEYLDVVYGVRQHHHAAGREHHVVVQFLRKRFPHLHGVIV